MLTSARTTFTTSRDVDKQVREAVASNTSLYSLDVEMLQSLNPSTILTQDLCNVCSIDLAAVHIAASKMSPKPHVISLDPQNMQDIVDDICKVGHAIGRGTESLDVRLGLLKRVKAAMDKASSLRRLQGRLTSPRPSVALLEWIDPIFIGMHHALSKRERKRSTTTSQYANPLYIIHNPLVSSLE